jgi:hypothetical protein
VKLTPPARLDLSVHAHRAALDERARLAARVGESGELEELTEPDRVAADRDVAGHRRGDRRTSGDPPDPERRVVRRIRVAPAARGARAVR